MAQRRTCEVVFRSGTFSRDVSRGEQIPGECFVPWRLIFVDT